MNLALFCEELGVASMKVCQSKSVKEKRENAIEKILTHDNFNRTRSLAVILFLTNLIFLFIDYLNNLKGLWIIIEGYRYLFSMRLV